MLLDQNWIKLSDWKGVAMKRQIPVRSSRLFWRAALVIQAGTVLMSKGASNSAAKKIVKIVEKLLINKHVF